MGQGQRGYYDEGDYEPGRTGRTWEEVSTGYRQDWERRYGASGRRWEEVEPAYRYGHELGADPRYRGRDWTEIEPEFRSGYADWARRQGYQSDESAWERLKDDVREAWERVRGTIH